MKTKTHCPPTSRTVRVLYIVLWESVTQNPLLEQQAYKLLSTMAGKDPDIQISLLNAGAFAKGRLRDFFVQFKPVQKLLGNCRRTRIDTQALKVSLQQQQVDCHFRETLFTPRASRPYASACTLGLFLLWNTAFLFRLLRRGSFDLVHARSYPAAVWAVFTRRVFRLPIKIIFDTRGLYPEEGCMFGSFAANRFTYRTWKRLERWLLSQCDAVVNVSETFNEHMKRIAPGAAYHVIHTNADVQAFAQPRPLKATEQGAAVQQALDGHVTLTYLGSLSPKGWYSLEHLAQLYLTFRRAFDSTRFLIITLADHAWVRQGLAAAGLPEDEIILTSSSNTEQTASLLSAAHYAAIPFHSGASDMEITVAYTVISAKTGEYLAAGLPLLCNQYIGAAAQLTDSAACGLVFSADQLDETFVHRLKQLHTRYPEVSARCRAASSRFALEENARRYAALYFTLTGRSDA